MRNAKFLFALPDIKRMPTAPTMAMAFARKFSAGGNTMVICMIEAKMLLGISIKSNPTSKRYQSTVSHRKSMYFLSRRLR